MSSSWLPYRQRRPLAKARLFCFPFAGGAASVYRPWETLLPATVELCAVQLPGREGRLVEAPFADLDALLESLVFALEPHCNLPFALFGHSFGALLAYELAKRLADRGAAPFLMFASGRNAPCHRVSDPVHHLPDDPFLERLIQMNGIAPLVLQSQEMLELVLPVIRSDVSMSETYVPTDTRRLPCTISVFGGLADPWVQRQGLDDWGQYAETGFRLRMLPGDHFFLRSHPELLVGALVDDMRNEVPDLF